LRKYSRFARVLLAIGSVSLLSTVTFAAVVPVRAPMVCSRGPNDAAYTAVLTMPASAPTGSAFSVRIDSLSSGIISHTGLNYIFDMTTDYLVPTGTTYVEGSARVVPDTGTQNVRDGAKAWHDAAGIHLALPAHIPNGSSYTPPSLEFSVKITAPAGSNIAIKFSHYEVTANAFLVGDVHTTCDPNPKPYALAVLHVDPAVTP
jgi:hypothetical protein